MKHMCKPNCFFIVLFQKALESAFLTEIYLNIVA